WVSNGRSAARLRYGAPSASAVPAAPLVRNRRRVSPSIAKDLAVTVAPINRFAGSTVHVLFDSWPKDLRPPCDSLFPHGGCADQHRSRRPRWCTNQDANLLGARMSAGKRLPGTPEPMHHWNGTGGVVIAGD